MKQLYLFLFSLCLVTAASHAAPLTVSLVVEQQVNCFSGSDGRVTASASGGAGGYRYFWSTGASGTATLESLAAGSYSVTVTDTAGDSAQASVIIAQPAALDVRASAGRQITCYTAADGRATVAVTGGTPPYQYNWSNGATTVTTAGLSPGLYEVVVSDANLCGTSSSVTIREPDSLALAFVTTGDAGPGDGTATTTATGGTAPYTYAWSTDPVQRTAGVRNLPAGTYAVTVSDANGCTATDSATVDRLPAGARCGTALAVDSLLEGEVDEPRYLSALHTGSYPGHGAAENDRPACFTGRDTLSPSVWTTFTGNGRPYRIRAAYCGPGADPKGVRMALYAGSCGEAAVRACVSDSTIEIATQPGQTYTLLIADTLTAGSTRCLEITATSTTAVDRVAPTRISLYPNPSRGRVRLDRFAAREVTVYDAAGHRVALITDPGTELDLSGYAAGVYHLRITDGGARTYVARVVKQ